MTELLVSEYPNMFEQGVHLALVEGPDSEYPHMVDFLILPVPKAILNRVVVCLAVYFNRDSKTSAVEVEYPKTKLLLSGESNPFEFLKIVLSPIFGRISVGLEFLLPNHSSKPLGLLAVIGPNPTPNHGLIMGGRDLFCQDKKTSEGSKE